MRVCCVTEVSERCDCAWPAHTLLVPHTANRKNCEIVNFEDGHPQRGTHCLARDRPKARQRVKIHGSTGMMVINVTYEQRHLLDDDYVRQRHLWALCVSTAWRTCGDLAARNWTVLSSKRSQSLAAVKAVSTLIKNVRMMGVRAGAGGVRGNAADRRAGSTVDWVSADAPVTARGVPQADGDAASAAHVLVDSAPDDIDCDGADDMLGSAEDGGGPIGAAAGVSAVLAARLAGLMPAARHLPSGGGEQDVVQQLDNNERSAFFIAAGELKAVRHAARALSQDDQEGSDDSGADSDGEHMDIDNDDQDAPPARLPRNTMGHILAAWHDSSVALSSCNGEQRAAVYLAVLSLASACSEGSDDAAAFSAVVQGSGGTGKTRSVIQAVREFVDQLCNSTHEESWRELVLVLAPTNQVALAIQGLTIDSGLFNRRSSKCDPQPLCSPLVRLMLVDEFSMVSLDWVTKISKALQDACGTPMRPFGGVSVVWIGDVHQLQPVKGLSVTSKTPSTKTDVAGRALWTGAQWSMMERRSFAVLMRTQYRMQEPLASITERFASNTQTLADAQQLWRTRQLRGAKPDDWRAQFEANVPATRLLCTDNNSKGALNWELAQWLGSAMPGYYEWVATNADARDTRRNEVVDQLEPRQCAWPWMPIVCLENYAGTGAVNGALCYIVKVIVADDDIDEIEAETNERRIAKMPSAVLVVAAPSKSAAMALVGDAANDNDALSMLLAERKVVALKPVMREGRRALPYAPVWAMTVHKAQGATLAGAVLNMVGQMSAPLLYTALTRVRSLEELWFLRQLSPALYLGLRFAPAVQQEMDRLRGLENTTHRHLAVQVAHWHPYVVAAAPNTQFGVHQLDSFRDVIAAHVPIQANVFVDAQAARARGDFVAADLAQLAGDNGADDGLTFNRTKALTVPIVRLNNNRIDGANTVLNDANWVTAATMFNCPLVLYRAAHALGPLPMPDVQGDWSADQANHIRRVHLLQCILDAKTHNNGTHSATVWALVAKREKENEWKKIFKETCGKVMKKALKNSK